MKNKEVIEFLAAYNTFSEAENKSNAKHVIELGIKAFNASLGHEDPLKRFDMVNQIVRCMKFLIQYDSSAADFLLARKKMTNYSLLVQLSDPKKVSFTLQDCELLNQRYRALQAEKAETNI